MEGFGPRDSLSEFTLTEIKDMEKIFKEIGEQSLGQAFFQDIATSFSCSASRAGKSAITWEQVQSWYQNRQEQLQDKVTPSSGALKLFDDLSDVPISSKAPESSLNPKGKKISDLSGLTYEAKSKKDNAWYDVASFLNYKFLSTGELINVRHEPQLLGLFQARASFGPLLAVRVRFSGFGNEEDEWVNVKRGVRERSIPLEHSECQKVKVGDLVLCFQEREDHAVYHDAYVVGIHKRQHDIRGCRCIFTVRYDHDNTEEKVDLGRICCRPKHYSQSDLDIEVGPTQHYSQPTFDIQEGVKFPF